MWVGWDSSVHAQGPYKHLTPDNPDFERKVQVQCFLLLFVFFFLFQPRLRQEVSPQKLRRQAKLRSPRRRERGDGSSLSSPLRSLLASFPLSTGSRTSPPSLLHHGADRRVRQVELARDVSGWVLLQRWRDTGGKEEGRHRTGCHSWQEKHSEGSSCC